MLATAKLSVTDNTLSVSMVGKFGPALTEMLAQAPAIIQSRAKEMQAENNFKQIGLAIHNYHDSFGRLPTDVVDAKGKPLLSWRVQLLPYFGHYELNRQIDMTKAWDDPANAKLWNKMPKMFEIPGRDAKPGMTYIQMPSSKGDFAFKQLGKKYGFSSITDGTSNTIMVVEARDAVNWMKPDDVSFDGKTLPKFGDAKRAKFIVGMANGSVRSVIAIRENRCVESVAHAPRRRGFQH